MKEKYYAYESLGVEKDCLGDIGPEIQISHLKYWVMRILGYRVSTEPICVGKYQKKNNRKPSIINLGQDKV